MPKKKKKKNNKENGFISFVKGLLTAGLAVVVAVVVMIKMFLATQPPIHNLENYKPNQVTQIYSADGELIKTFTAYKFQQVHIKDVPQNLMVLSVQLLQTFRQEELFKVQVQLPSSFREFCSSLMKEVLTEKLKKLLSLQELKNL